MSGPAYEYRTYARPKLSLHLEALGLDKIYVEGEGARLTYVDKQSQKRIVDDFVGGYGAALLGHNHPDLVREAAVTLASRAVNHAQGSVRAEAGQLAAKLSSLLKRQKDETWITTLVNTGTEAVEAARRHALLAHEDKAADFIQKLARLTEKNLRLASAEDLNELASELRYLGIHVSSTDPRSLAIHLNHYNETLIRDFLPVVVTMAHSFHGRTKGSYELTDQDGRGELNDRPVDGVLRIRPDAATLQGIFGSYFVNLRYFGNSSDGSRLKATKLSLVAAVFLEPVQGEAGIFPLKSEFIDTCRDLCSRDGAILVFDESQCGLGRTGSLLAANAAHTFADCYIFAKVLGGGLCKVGAMSVRESLYSARFGYSYTSTFGEDALSSRIALKTLDILMNGDTLPTIGQKSQKIRDKLDQLVAANSDVLKEARGIGLMIGLEFQSQSRAGSPVFRALNDQNMLGYAISSYLLNAWDVRVLPTLASPMTLRLQPPAAIDDSAIDNLLQALTKVCEIIRKQNAYALIAPTLGAANDQAAWRDRPIQDYRQTNSCTDQAAESRVAFIGHFITADHMTLFEPSFKEFQAQERDELIDRFHLLIKPKIYQKIPVKSANGRTVELNFIGLFVDSRTIENYIRGQNVAAMRELVNDAVSVAENEGCTIVGLGGYTSIVTSNGLALPSRNVNVTSGNSLTVGMGLRALTTAARDSGIDLSKAVFAGVGATGNICSTYSLMMASFVPRIILIGRPQRQARLREVQRQILDCELAKAINYLRRAASLGPSGRPNGVGGVLVDLPLVQDAAASPGCDHDVILDAVIDFCDYDLKDASPVICSTDINDLKRANLIVSASNSASAVVHAEVLTTNPCVICDISVPPDVDPSVSRLRPNAKVICGGIVDLPRNKDFIIDGIPLGRGQSYACMAETILLGLTDYPTHFSLGEIQPTQVTDILAMSDDHGLTLSTALYERSY